MLQTVNIQLVLMKKPRFAEKNIYYREKATNFLKVFLLHTTQRHLLFGLWEVGCQNIYNFDLFGFQLLPDPQGEVKPKTAVAIGNFFFIFFAQTTSFSIQRGRDAKGDFDNGTPCMQCLYGSHSSEIVEDLRSKKFFQQNASKYVILYV